MAIKLSYAQLNAEGLNQALSYLTSQTGFASFQVTYNVSRILRQFEKELKTAREMYTAWTKDFFVKGEDGNFKIAEKPTKSSPFEIVEGKAEEFEKKMEDFLATEVELTSYPLKPEDIAGVKLTPAQIFSLEPIFDQEAFAQLVESPHKA